MKSGTTFILMVIAAFASAISFFQVDSAFSDSHNLNGPFDSLNGLFIAAGIISAIAAIYFLIMTIKKA